MSDPDIEAGTHKQLEHDHRVNASAYSEEYTVRPGKQVMLRDKGFETFDHVTKIIRMGGL
jgi:hypothetical protein